ncbi:ATP-dependent Clp protease ATP-binding subunit ClpX, partial [Candidatus Hakubella thermalkaliphila]
TEDALRAIARKALIRGTGARGLRSILEEIMLGAMYEIPSRSDVRKCVITKEIVENRLEPTLVTVTTSGSKAAGGAELSA